MMFSLPLTAEPADRREAIAQVAAAAALIRKKDPYSPAPYLMLRGLRWGELRASSDPSILEAPPSDLRLQVKALALTTNGPSCWNGPKTSWHCPAAAHGSICSGSWWKPAPRSATIITPLPLQSVRIAGVTSRFALLLDASSRTTPCGQCRDTKVAQGDSGRAGAGRGSGKTPPKVPVMDNGKNPAGKKNSWTRTRSRRRLCAPDSRRKAVTILQKEVERQFTGRGRFQRKCNWPRSASQAGKDAIAQPLLDDIAAAIETHKLEDWEDREMVAAALIFLVQNSKKLRPMPRRSRRLFDRICRLDPVQACRSRESMIHRRDTWTPGKPERRPVALVTAQSHACVTEPRPPGADFCVLRVSASRR